MKKNLNLKKIQEFFSKPLEENTFKKGDKVTYLGHPAVVTATKEYNGRDFVSVSYDKGTGKTSASMILATSGDVKAVNKFDKFELDSDLNETKYRVEYTTQDGEKAKSRMYNSEEEADKKEKKLVDSGVRKAKVVKAAESVNEAKVDYDFSERELIRVLRQLKRGASTEIDMIKAFTRALGRDITKDELFSEAIAENSSSNLMATLTNGGKLAKPTGGASMNGQYYQLQGGTEYDVIHFDYDSSSEKPFGIVQVAGHHMPTQLLRSLGFRETRSWTAGVEVYIFDGNFNPKYISEKEMAQLVEEWGKGVSSYAKTMGDFYRGRGRTSGTIDENKMPTQDQVDRFFALTQNEIHYLNSKPVAGQEGTFNLMKVEPWDEYDLSNWMALVRKAKSLGKVSEAKFKPHMMYDPKTGKGYKANKKEDHERMDKMGYTHEKPSVKESISQTLAETIKLGEGVIEEELCPKGKAYIKRRKAAGEKSSAYLSGRAVKVCKGQMSGRKKKK